MNGRALLSGEVITIMISTVLQSSVLIRLQVP